MEWQDVIDKAKADGYLSEIKDKITSLRKHGIIIMPEDKDLFNPFKLTPYNKVKVCILGNEPYHTKGLNHGLAFSSYSNQRPGTQEILFKEVKRDYFPELSNSNTNAFKVNDLTCWAEKGVLLINNVFTIELGSPRSHQTLGWQRFTEDVIKALNKKEKPIVFMFWGNSAYKHLISNKHLILECEYPLVNSNFNGCSHFTQANRFLLKHYEIGINWSVLQSDTAILRN
jgi:uracil-DNA glycosylase